MSKKHCDRTGFPRQFCSVCATPRGGEGGLIPENKPVGRRARRKRKEVVRV